MSGNKGGRVCSVLGCDNGQDPTSQKKLSFHVFPKDDELRLEWFRLIKNSNVSKWSRVCSEHFKEDDYSRTLVQGEYWYSGSLKKEAVPSLKLPNDEWTPGKKRSTSSQMVPPVIPVLTAPSKSYCGTSNGSDRRDFYSRVYPGTRMDPLGSQIVLNVFSQLARFDPGKTNQALAEKTSELTGVDCGVVFQLKEGRISRLKKAAAAVGGVGIGTPSSSRERIPASAALMAKYPPAQLRRQQSRNKLWKPSSNADGIRPDSNSILISAKELSTTSPSVRRLRTSVVNDIEKRRRISPGHQRILQAPPPSRVREIPEMERYDESVLTGIRLKMNEYLGREEPKSLWGFWREIIADDELPNFPRNEFVELMNDMGLASHFVQSERRQPARPLSRRNKKKKLEPDFEYGD